MFFHSTLIFPIVFTAHDSLIIFMALFLRLNRRSTVSGRKWFWAECLCWRLKLWEVQPFTIRKLGVKLDLWAALGILLEYSRMYIIGKLLQAEVLQALLLNFHHSRPSLLTDVGSVLFSQKDLPLSFWWKALPTEITPWNVCTRRECRKIKTGLKT